MPNDNYNASVGQRVDLNPDLIILRVATDDPLFDFQAGQYTVLGLAASSPRVPFSDQEDPPEAERLIRRAYSISSSSRRKEYSRILHFSGSVRCLDTAAVRPARGRPSVGGKQSSGPVYTCQRRWFPRPRSNIYWHGAGALHLNDPYCPSLSPGPKVLRSPRGQILLGPRLSLRARSPGSRLRDLHLPSHDYPPRKGSKMERSCGPHTDSS